MKLKIVVPEYEKSVIFVYGNITQSLSRFLKSNYHPITNHKSNIQDKYDSLILSSIYVLQWQQDFSWKDVPTLLL